MPKVREPGVYRPRFRDKVTGERKKSAVWWINWTDARGVRHRESSGSEQQEEAVRIRRAKLHAVDHGRPAGSDVQRTSFEDLARLIETDYTTNGKRSLRRLRGSIVHLSRAFKGMPAVKIDEERIDRYVAERKAQEAANGTINRELTTLKRAFRLAKKLKRVAAVPEIGMLAEATPRQGFVEQADFSRLLSHLSADLRAPLEAAYITGWRLASEIFTRRWKHVDFKAGWLRLEPGETKNGDGRMFPLTPELRAVLERQRDLTEALQRKQGRIIPWIFHRCGEPIRQIQKNWDQATLAAGLKGLIPHDLRRTAVRNLERAGVPRSAAMKLVGHKTESVYRRYAITDEAMLQEAGAKLSAFHRNSYVKVASKSEGSEAAEKFAEASADEEVELEAASGLEPESRGFADLRLNHLATPPRAPHYKRRPGVDQGPSGGPTLPGKSHFAGVQEG